MKQAKARSFLPVLLALSMGLAAQEHNSVPLDHPAYNVIAMGVMRGVISPPSSARPWSHTVVKEKLWEMISDPEQLLSSRETDTVSIVLESLEREIGFDPERGRYHVKGGDYTVEVGFGWESDFSVEAPSGSVASVNMAKVYAGGDLSDFVSWNVALMGGFLYIDGGIPAHWIGRPEQGDISPFFPYSYSRQWDGGVLLLRRAAGYSAWPVDPALAGGFLAELNGVFFNQKLELRLGRIRRDWGPGSNGASLFINAHARPFAAIEGTYLPLPWLGVSFLNGALEHYREDSEWSGGDGPFANMLSAAQVELNPVQYVHFSLGGSAVWFKEINLAAFSSLELKLPGLLKIWGSLFVDRLDSFPENFTSMNSNSYAWQAGINTVMHWLPFAFFTLRYTKVEPYCYTNTYTGNGSESGFASNAFVSGGESLGYYTPPNSDEVVARIESMLFPEVHAHIQFQMLRHSTEYALGSSLRETLKDTDSTKSFMKDGVYRWDYTIKLGTTFNVRMGPAPLAIYAEAGVALTRFSKNGDAGSGNEAEWEFFSDQARDGFIFSIGFKLYP